MKDHQERESPTNKSSSFQSTTTGQPVLSVSSNSPPLPYETMNGPPHYPNTDTLPLTYENSNASLPLDSILNAVPPPHQNIDVQPTNRNIHILPLADLNTNTLPPLGNTNARASSISTSLPSFSSIMKLQRLRQWLLQAPSIESQEQQDFDMLIERLGLAGPFNQQQLEEIRLFRIRQLLLSLSSVDPEKYKPSQQLCQQVTDDEQVLWKEVQLKWKVARQLASNKKLLQEQRTLFEMHKMLANLQSKTSTPKNSTLHQQDELKIQLHQRQLEWLMQMQQWLQEQPQ